MDGITFTLLYTGGALTYTPTDGNLIITKELTTSETVSEQVESAATETGMGTTTVTVLGVCITVDNIIAASDFEITDTSTCSLTCSTTTEDVVIGDEEDDGDLEVDGDLELDGDLVVEGSGEECDDVITGWNWPTITTSGNSQTFTFSTFAENGLSLAARFSELQRQLTADAVEFRLQTPQMVADLGTAVADTTTVSISGTGDLVTDPNNPYVVVLNVNDALSLTDLAASYTRDNAVIDEADIMGGQEISLSIESFVTIGDNSFSISGHTDNGDGTIDLVLGYTLTGAADIADINAGTYTVVAGALASISYTASTTSEVEAAIAVPRGTVATRNSTSISFTLPNAVNNQNILTQVTSGVLDTFGLTNCPALTVGDDVVIVGGDLIILPDGNGDGGDIIVDGDLCIGDDLDVDGDITTGGLCQGTGLGTLAFPGSVDNTITGSNGEAASISISDAAIRSAVSSGDLLVVQNSTTGTYGTYEVTWTVTGRFGLRRDPNLLCNITSPQLNGATVFLAGLCSTEIDDGDGNGDGDVIIIDDIIIDGDLCDDDGGMDNMCLPDPEEPESDNFHLEVYRYASVASLPTNFNPTGASSYNVGTQS